MARRVSLKSSEQIAGMRRAGLVVAKALAAMRESVRPGITTADLDAIAARVIRDAGASPSFLGYFGYPATVCVSVNDEVVHGIPGSRVLAEGDLVSIDCGAVVDGWHGDAALSVGVGTLTVEDAALLKACEDSMWAGIAAMQVGGRLSDISAAVETSARAAGDYGIVKDFTGHGIGTEMHQDPAVPNYGRPGRGLRLDVGLTLAIEPMITRGTEEVAELDDGWTAVTLDGSRAAHFEHTVALTDEGPRVLTALDWGANRLG